MVRKGKIKPILMIPTAFIVFLIGWFIQSVGSIDKREVRKAPVNRVYEGISLQVLLPEEQSVSM